MARSHHVTLMAKKNFKTSKKPRFRRENRCSWRTANEKAFDTACPKPILGRISLINVAQPDCRTTPAAGAVVELKESFTWPAAGKHASAASGKMESAMRYGKGILARFLGLGKGWRRRDLRKQSRNGRRLAIESLEARQLLTAAPLALTASANPVAAGAAVTFTATAPGSYAGNYVSFCGKIRLPWEPRNN